MERTKGFDVRENASKNTQQRPLQISGKIFPSHISCSAFGARLFSFPSNETHWSFFREMISLGIGGKSSERCNLKLAARLQTLISSCWRFSGLDKKMIPAASLEKKISPSVFCLAHIDRPNLTRVSISPKIRRRL